MSTELEFKRECEGLVREYFTHGVVTDVEDSLKELLGRPGWTEHGEGLGPDRSDRTPPHRSDGAPPGSSSSAPYAPSPLAPSSLTTPSSLSAASLRAMVVKRAVIAALDRGAREREMAAQLLRALRDKNVISRAHGEAGFDLLLQALESLTIDVPNAPDDMHVFLARAVVDGVVSDEYLEECADAAGLDVEARRVALSARGALRAPGGRERVLDAWGGPEGGTASAAVREMDSLLAEYVESRDAREASRRLVSLHVPFYHHELVKRALVTAVEESYARPQVTRRVTELLGYLGAAGVVSGTQFAKGFARVAVALKELVLDTPDAQEIFERLVADARGRGLLPAGLSAWASFRVGGGGTGAALGRTDGDAMVRDRESASLPRARGGRGGGHLMRLDSAPDLIALAQSLKTVGLEKEKSAPGGERASPLANGAGSRGSPLKGSVNPGPGLVEKEKSRMSPSRLAAQSATAKGAPPKPSSSPEPKPFSTSQQGVLSAVPARVSKSNQVDANWSGLRAPRAGRRDRGASGSAFSGSDSDYVRPKPKRRLPDLRFPNRGDGGGGGAEGASSERPKPVGFGGFAGTRARSPALGRSAWKARFQPAPSRCSGEETRAFKSEASLRRVRALRRVRSAPAGLHELDTSAHVLSIGTVHRHRPFASEYEVGEAIGTGGFAVVRKAAHRATGETFAVKTLRVRAGGGASDDESDSASDAETENSDSGSDSDASDETDPETRGKTRKLAAMSMGEMTNELIMMQQLSGHPNIVTVKEFFTEDARGRATSGVAPSSSEKKSSDDDGVVHVVMELLEGQELVDAIEQHGLYDESDAKIVMSKMLDAIAFMHARGVVHRDLKLENLVLAKPDDLSTVTLVDFGLAKALMARERAENVCGTLAYVAPEALAAGQYGQGVDVWALGVAMHVLLTGVWPFDDEDEDELMDAIIACDLDFDGPDAPEEFSWISPDAKDLLRGLLEPNPKHRLTAAQAVEHAWFTGQRENRAERLRHVHARLDALAGSSRQHPERRFKKGAELAAAGAASTEVFVITSGECDAFAPASGPLAAPGELTKIGTRRKGNLVGEIPADDIRGGGGDASVAPASKLTVRATTEVRALVFQRADAVWAAGHDYRLSDEFEDALRERRRLLAKKARLALRAERAAAASLPASAPGGADAFAGFADRRATSEIQRRE